MITQNKQMTDKVQSSSRRSIDSLLFVAANQVVHSQAMDHDQANGRVFVPITDDIIFDHPEQIKGPLVPYFSGMECQNWLSIEINPDEENPDNKSEITSTELATSRAVPKPTLALVKN